MLIPYQVDVPFERKPLTNYILIAATTVLFLCQLSTENQYRNRVERAAERSVQNDPNITIKQALTDTKQKIKDPTDKFVLRDFSASGMFGHMFMHGGWLHIIGNMMFLWVFGNAVCAKLGNGKYALLYITLGLLAGAGQLMFDGTPSIGASGAISGIIGMYLVLFPQNDISCMIFFNIRPYFFSCSGYWIILYRFIWDDVLGAILGGGHVAYMCHISGFIAGVIVAMAMLCLKLIVMEKDERSLYEVFNLARLFSRVSAQEQPVKENKVASSRFEPAVGRRNIPADNESERRLSMEEPAEAPPPDLNFDFNSIPTGFGNLDIGDEMPAQKIDPGEPKVAPAPVSPKIAVSGQMQQTHSKAAPINKQSDSPKSVNPDMIRFACSCGHKYKVPSSAAGKKARCPKCQAIVTVPAKTILRIEDLKI